MRRLRGATVPLRGIAAVFQWRRAAAIDRRRRLVSANDHKAVYPFVNPLPTKKTKWLAGANRLTLVFFGRGGGIRTRDPLHHMKVLSD